MNSGSVSRHLLPATGLLALGTLWSVLVERTLAPADDSLRILLHALFALAAAAALAWVARRRDDPHWDRARTFTFLAETQALAHVGCWTWDIGTDRAEWSDELYRIYGLEPGEPMDFNRFLAAVHPDDRSHVQELINRAVETGEAYAYEERIVRPDGTVRDILGKGRVDRGEDGRPIRLYGVCQDVTEREESRRTLLRNEEELQRGAKMEAIGRLAAGAAHDFNNLLTSIRGYTDLTLRSEDLSAPHRVALEEVLNAADRASQLTRQLLALGKEVEPQPERVDLNSITRGMEPMIAPHCRERISLRLDLDPDLWPVRADPLQLEQVILNLAVNAADAMPEGGELEIRTANEPADPGGSRGPRVRLEVRDTGSGIPEEVRPHLFEPFYTTKGGGGTGLGLATVYAIVMRNRGSIDFTTGKGQGTTFVIRLPRHLSALEDDSPM